MEDAGWDGLLAGYSEDSPGSLIVIHTELKDEFESCRTSKKTNGKTRAS
jgi:hypothetical protein